MGQAESDDNPYELSVKDIRVDIKSYCRGFTCQTLINAMSLSFVLEGN